MVKKIKQEFTEDIVAIYNIFAPVTYLKWLLGEVSGGDDLIADFLVEDPEALKNVLDVIAEDIASLSRAVIEEAGADGIYLSVQSIQDQRVSAADYQAVIAPSEITVLEAASAVGGVTVLHICGYEGARNDIHLFADYPAQVFNWAVGPEGITLKEGREIFKDVRFLEDSKMARQAYCILVARMPFRQKQKKLVAEAGKQGLVLGADCTIQVISQLNVSSGERSLKTKGEKDE